MPKLTQRISDTTIAPASGQLIIRDEELKGFGLRVTPQKKTYIVDSRVNGVRRRVTIGRCDLLTLEEARLKARQVLLDMASGIEPTAEKRNEKVASITLIELLEEYLQVRTLKASTANVYRRVITKKLKDWLHMPIIEITKDMVAERHRLISSGSSKGTSGKGYANVCFKTLQTLLNYAGEKYEVDGKPLIAVNPVSRLTKTRAWNRLHPRTGIIPEYKLALWYQAVNGLASKGVRDYFLLLLFTGLRRSEGSCLKWTEVDFEAQTLTIRRSQAKNHRDHVLPLSKFLVDLLKERYANRTSSPYVFPGRGNKSHLTDFRFWMAQIKEKSGCNFMIHDTRRSFLSTAEQLEVPYYVLKRLANHTFSGDTLVPYIVVSNERLRLHMERITAHFLELMGVAGQLAAPTEIAV